MKLPVLFFFTKYNHHTTFSKVKKEDAPSTQEVPALSSDCKSDKKDEPTPAVASSSQSSAAAADGGACLLDMLQQPDATPASGAAFWQEKWRSKLCICDKCKVGITLGPVNMKTIFPGLDIKHLAYMPVGHVVLKIYMPCKIFYVPSQYLYKPCKAYVYCWENKYLVHAQTEKSLAQLGT